MRRGVVGALSECWRQFKSAGRGEDTGMKGRIRCFTCVFSAMNGRKQRASGGLAGVN